MPAARAEPAVVAPSEDAFTAQGFEVVGIRDRVLKEAPGSVLPIGTRGSGPAIAEKRKAASSTVRASGPITPSVSQALPTG